VLGLGLGEGRRTSDGKKKTAKYDMKRRVFLAGLGGRI